MRRRRESSTKLATLSTTLTQVRPHRRTHAHTHTRRANRRAHTRSHTESEGSMDFPCSLSRVLISKPRGRVLPRAGLRAAGHCPVHVHIQVPSRRGRGHPTPGPFLSLSLSWFLSFPSSHIIACTHTPLIRAKLLTHLSRIQ